MEPVVANMIGVAVILVIVAAIAVYLIRAKKKGAACAGCPYAKKCGGSCSCGNGTPKSE